LGESCGVKDDPVPVRLDSVRPVGDDVLEGDLIDPEPALTVVDAFLRPFAGLMTGEEGAEEAGDGGRVLPQLTQNLAGRSVGTGFPQNAQNLGTPTGAAEFMRRRRREGGREIRLKASRGSTLLRAQTRVSSSRSCSLRFRSFSIRPARVLEEAKESR
jgi:hypothetical protein